VGTMSEKVPYEPKCKKCGKILPLGLGLTVVCIECIIKRPK
jgi:hypothetical protein